jgi:hypothetical protein
MIELSSMIKYESNFLSKDIANKIYEYAKNNDDKFTEFGNGEKEFTVHTYHSIEKIDPNILSLLQDSAMSVYNYVKNNYGSNLIDFDPFKTHIARFEKGNGMHEHFDSSRPKDIATLVYIMRAEKYIFHTIIFILSQILAIFFVFQITQILFMELNLLPME